MGGKKVDSILQQLIRISKYAGQREDLVQAGGGNSSVKVDANKMLIKSSGFQMADITADSGFSEINYSLILDFFNKTPLEDISDKYEKQLLDDALITGLKPSIETFLHAITDTFTLHTHPVLVNVLACRENGMDILKELFPDALFIDYETPGIKLAREYFKSYKEKYEEEPRIYDVIFLKNHGLIVSAENAEEVIEKTENVLLKLEEYLNVDMQAYRNSTILYNAFAQVVNDDQIVYLSNDYHIKKISNMLKEKMLTYWFCPDCLVYCGKRPLILNKQFTIEDIRTHISNYGRPVIIYFNNNIYIYASNVKKAREIESVLSFSVQIVYLNQEYNLDYLKEEEQDFLLNWESEKYRQNLK
nr:class II aldolase/adducin family protein [Paenibacillus apiarius]